MPDLPPAVLKTQSNAGPGTTASEPVQSFGCHSAVAPPPLPSQTPRQHPWPLQPVDERQPHSTKPSPPTSDASAKPQRQRRSVGAPLGFITFGFIAGAVFWHAVGFWNLVHSAVFSGPRHEVTASHIPALPHPTRSFNEEALRNFSQRPNGPNWPKITTGSISDTAPAIATHPQLASPPDDNAERQPTGPGGISWQPAVKTSP